MSTDADAYLARLGLDAEPPSAAALGRLHRAHAERVPYETLWIHLGQRWSIDPAVSMARLSHQRRGGYCFHLNGAFSELLRALGYDVVRHVGGVHGPGGATLGEMTNHLVLTVRGLPDDDNPDGTWYVDVGLGDALHGPLPLRAGAHRQDPFRLVLSETPDGPGDWHLAHDHGGGFAGMAWMVEPTGMGAFADRHEWLSTSPDSGFVRVLTVQRREAGGVDILRGLTLRRVGQGAAEATLGTETELVDALTDVFGLDLHDVDRPSVRRLWARTHAAHEAWEAAGRP
jgi:N-hydroxyarylamine O-acetyltransferase